MKTFLISLLVLSGALAQTWVGNWNVENPNNTECQPVSPVVSTLTGGVVNLTGTFNNATECNKDGLDLAGVAFYMFGTPNGWSLNNSEVCFGFQGESICGINSEDVTVFANNTMLMGDQWLKLSGGMLAASFTGIIALFCILFA